MLGALQFGVLLGGVLAGRRRRTIISAAALLVVGIAEVALLYARGAWVAVGCVLAAAGVLLLSRGGAKRALAAAVAVVLVGAALAAANPTLKHMLLGGGGTTIEGTVVQIAPPQTRIELWRRTLRMVRDHAFTGVGLGNFQRVFESVYNPEVNTDLRRGVHAHNAWLQQFAEVGVLGGAAYVMLWGWVFVIAWRRAFAGRGFVSVAVLLALVALVASNMTTNMFYLPGQAPGRLYSLTWVFFGLVASQATRGSGLGTSD
jgi:O-antigen ligase